jgi:heme/copper-type cytochrome/quinol oxidase subunit 2
MPIPVQQVSDLAEVLNKHFVTGVISLLVFAVLGLFAVVMRQQAAHAKALKAEQDEKLRFAMRVVALVEKMAPFAPALAQVAAHLGDAPRPRKSRTGQTGAYPAVPSTQKAEGE